MKIRNKKINFVRHLIELDPLAAYIIINSVVYRKVNKTQTYHQLNIENYDRIQPIELKNKWMDII